MELLTLWFVRLLLLSAIVFGNDATTSTYAPGTTQYIVPNGVYFLRVTACGSAGGSHISKEYHNSDDDTLEDCSKPSIGNGGYIEDAFPVVPGTTLWIYVGSTTFNGAGYGSLTSGGGGTDIRTADGGADGSQNVNSRLMSAGGGGGSCTFVCNQKRYEIFGCSGSGHTKIASGGKGGGAVGGTGTYNDYGNTGQTHTPGGAGGPIWDSGTGSLWQGGHGSCGGGGGWNGGMADTITGGGGSSWSLSRPTGPLVNLQGDSRCSGPGFLTISALSSAPTVMPTSASPTIDLSALQSLNGGGAAAQTLDDVVTGSGALFYVIVAFAVVFGAIAVFLAQIKQGRSAVHQIGLIDGIATMALIGSSFCSEMFLVACVLHTPCRTCTSIGVILLLGRLLHIPASCSLLYRVFGRAVQGAAAPGLLSLLDTDFLFANSKAFGAVCALSLVESPLLRYLPWLSSAFAKKVEGYPNPTFFLVCVVTKLVQSTVTVSCQVSFFVIVNSEVTADTPKARQSLAFLIISMVTSVLLVVVNGFELFVKLSIVLAENSASKKTHPSPSGSQDTIPPPASVLVTVKNPVRALSVDDDDDDGSSAGVELQERRRGPPAAPV